MMSTIEEIRHSTAHILAAAVLQLWPNAKLGIGPTIENGFYYDFDLDHSFIPEDLTKIEKVMQNLIQKNNKFEKKLISVIEAKKQFKNDPYKIELIKEFEKEGKQLSFYKTGDFIDLCKGPHVESTKELGNFKLLKVSGSYWRGDAKNKPMQRIYGTAFPTKKELDNYLFMLEEAKKRDHKIIGEQLDLFSFHEEAPGMAFYHNKGLIIRNELINYWREEHKKEGYIEIQTPTLLSRELWETSGHWKLYKENMYTTKIDDKDFGIKPMNCSGGMLVYKSRLHSYKELPLRVAEMGNVHRHELSGVLNGLLRVRAFTQDDAHLFCMQEQLEDEIIKILKLIKKMLGTIGFTNYKYSLSIRSEKKKEKYLGTDENWNNAESTIKKALNKIGVEFQIMEGEAKFYGPSLDVQIKDALGREWQCSTIQLDFNLPERFDLTYEGSDGKKHRPVMLHRVIYGSLERFMGVLIEHYAGKFPLWLAPVQVSIMTIADRHIDYGKKLQEELKLYNIRVELDDRQESIPKKVRDNQIQHIPYLITIGDKEIESGNLAIRTRDNKVSSMKKQEFIEKILKEIKNKDVN